jgi:hypothetical protein
VFQRNISSTIKLPTNNATSTIKIFASVNNMQIPGAMNDAYQYS